MHTIVAASSLRLHLALEPGSAPRLVTLENVLAGTRHDVTASCALAVVLSAAAERVAEPRWRIADFVVAEPVVMGAEGAATVRLRSPGSGLEADVSWTPGSAEIRKTAVIRNTTDHEILVLDIVLQEAAFGSATTGASAGASTGAAPGTSRGVSLEGGGQGEPIFIGGDLFAAVEHPSGWNEIIPGPDGATAVFQHCPGRRLSPGAELHSRPLLLCASRPGQAREAFVSWIQDHGRRKAKGLVSVYTPFGINNQWGLAGTLDDEQTLHVVGTLADWRSRGVTFDYFTLDTGWVDYGSDLTRFRPVAFPEGGTPVVDAVEATGMKFGLWFATSWASQSCWDNPAAWGGRPLPPLTWRNGNPALTDYAASFCLAAPPYFEMLKAAVLHHVRNSGARFLKFDGGNYACNDESHGHLPGRYAVERMHDLLIELADAARAECPDVFIMWYWGLRSPFWALHGDTIFESGLYMEGSGTSAVPSLYYRDSVTLAQDQNACHVAHIPPVAKDSLGVWLADTRWGNFMGRERWRESLVMDLGRGNLLFPNLWGDLSLLDDDDTRFLAEMERFAREHEALLLSPRSVIGDPMANTPYGYAYFNDEQGLVFLNNVAFVPRGVDLDLAALGARFPRGAAPAVISRFPEEAALVSNNGARPGAGGVLHVTLRPFETLLLEVRPASGGRGRRGRRPATVRLPPAAAARLGAQLALRPAGLDPDLAVRFADEARFAQLGHGPSVQVFAADLPALEGPETTLLSVVVRLRKDGADWKYSPAVCEIVQATARIGKERVFFVPVPDARQFGNTQKAGCSWVVYKTRVPRRWSGSSLRIAVHAFLPPGVEAQVEAFVTRRWWNESARPVGDSYYADAPS